MRLAFWRAGKDKAVIARAVAKPKAEAAPKAEAKIETKVEAEVEAKGETRPAAVHESRQAQPA